MAKKKTKNSFRLCVHRGQKIQEAMDELDMLGYVVLDEEKAYMYLTENNDAKMVRSLQMALKLIEKGALS